MLISQIPISIWSGVLPSGAGEDHSATAIETADSTAEARAYELTTDDQLLETADAQN